MRRIILVGARHRGWNPARSYQTQTASADDERLVSAMLQRWQREGEFLIASLGCDIGFGRMVQAACEDRKIPFIEVRVKRSRRVPQSIYELLHIARHAALMELGTEFHVFIADSRVSNIEDLVQRLELQHEKRPYYIYAEDGTVISTNQEE